MDQIIHRIWLVQNFNMNVKNIKKIYSIIKILKYETLFIFLVGVVVIDYN